MFYTPSMLLERDTIRFMVGQGLKKGLATVRSMRRALTEEDQERVAEAIVHELETNNWKVTLGEPGRPSGQRSWRGRRGRA